MSASSQKHKAEAPTKLGFVLIMCSTSRFADWKEGKSVDDRSGDLIVQTLEKSCHKVVSRVLVPDNREMIEDAVKKALSHKNVEAIIVCGGTGITPKDVTIEAITPMLQKVLPGFGELFRKLSYDKIGSAAVLSRAVAGVADGKAVFCIPGSVDAVWLCLDKLILPETGHIVKHAWEEP
ncbi:MAG: molybdenum cofactor biosynthesis protein B [Candidatus Bathyarchaeia archaeon]